MVAHLRLCVCVKIHGRVGIGSALINVGQRRAIKNDASRACEHEAPHTNSAAGSENVLSAIHVHSLHQRLGGRCILCCWGGSCGVEYNIYALEGGCHAACICEVAFDEFNPWNLWGGGVQVQNFH